MPHRTTILLDDDTYERLKRRARQRGTSVSEAVRETLRGELSGDDPARAWLDFVDEMVKAAVPQAGPPPPIDSDEARDEWAREIYRDAMNREPDW